MKQASAADRSVGEGPVLSDHWVGEIADAEADLKLDPARLLDGCDRDQLERMLAAADELLNVYRVIAKTEDNIVGLLLKQSETFYEWDHYPKGDVYDPETHSQYYYHAHRGATGEHGHFHTFLRARGMQPDVRPLPLERDEPWPTGNDALAHLVAVSMNALGVPTHLFSTNRWVTGETLYSAHDVIAMLDRFEMDLIWPEWPVNRWLNALMVLFRPQVEVLLHRRDAVIRDRLQKADGTDVLEDRELEITALTRIDADQQIAAIRARLGRQV